MLSIQVFCLVDWDEFVALCIATDALNQPVSHGCHYVLDDNKSIIDEPEQVIEANL